MWSKHGSCFRELILKHLMHNLGESKDQTKPKKSTKSRKIIIGGFFFQAEDGIRDRSPSRGLGDVYKRQNDVHEESHMK